MKPPYPHVQNNTLFQLLQKPDFRKALVRLVDFKLHHNLQIKAEEHSILIFNSEVMLAVVIYSGFETHEYDFLKCYKNLQLLTFSDVMLDMVEFRGVPLKYVDKMSWFFSVINTSDDEAVKSLASLNGLKLG